MFSACKAIKTSTDSYQFCMASMGIGRTQIAFGAPDACAHERLARQARQLVGHRARQSVGAATGNHRDGHAQRLAPPSALRQIGG